MQHLVLAGFGFHSVFARAGARQNSDPTLSVKFAQPVNFFWGASGLRGLFGGLPWDYGSKSSLSRRRQRRIYDCEQGGWSRYASPGAGAQSGERAERGQRRRVRDRVVLDQVTIILGSQGLERQIPQDRVGRDDQMLARGELLLRRFEQQVVCLAPLRPRRIAAA